MQSLRIGNYVAQCSPTRDTGALAAKLAKCNGKYKPSTIKTCKRNYPLFGGEMSTADYVAAYASANRWIGYAEFFAPLNTEPCTLYSGADYCETIDDDNVVDFPQSLALAA